MSKYLVRFHVQYVAEVDTDDADNYPEEIVQDCVSEEHMVSAMAVWDAENSDGPIESWAEFESVQVDRAFKMASTK